MAGPFAVLAGLASFFLAAPPSPETAYDSVSPAPIHSEGEDAWQDGWLIVLGSPAVAQGGVSNEAAPSARKAATSQNANSPTSSEALSQVPPTRRATGTSNRGILAGGGPATTFEPVEHPYFLGWSADVGSGRELLKPTLELGGATVDPRSGWVYVATRDGKLICLVNGERRWEASLGAPAFAPPTVHREAVVVGASNGVLHTFNKVTGERRNRVILEEELITQPVVVRTEAGLRAYIGSSAESLFAADIELGRRLWRVHRDAPPGFTVRGFAAPVVTSNTVFAAHADGVVSALDPESGVVLWERRVSPPGELVDVDSLATDGRLLFAASFTGGVMALDPETGSTVWRADIPQVHHLRFDDGSLYVVAPGRVSSLVPNDGSIRWSTSIAGVGVLSAPAPGSGLISLTEDAGPLHFLDATSGVYVGSFAPGAGFSSPPSSAGRTLYALSNGGRVYSLGLLPPAR